MARHVIIGEEGIWVKNRTGRLMRMEEDESSRYKYEIWFEYTRRAMNEIKEGTMLAVRNFSSDATETHYSILEVTGLKPVHYALGEDPQGFPGFVMEAAKSASQDWIEQDNESLEDTTVIRCTAIPTNLEIVEYSDGSMIFEEESNIPMIGEEVKLLTTRVTEQVVNRDLDLENEDLMCLGSLIRDKDVRVYLRYEEFVKVHFGIFGFTGAGKSNLLSTLISKMLSESSQPLKIVLFDLMSEYTALLIDQLLTIESAYFVCLGVNTLPAPVFRYINGDTSVSRSQAAESFSRYALLPKALKSYQPKMEEALARLMDSKKIRVFSVRENMSVYDLFYGDHDRAPKNIKQRKAQKNNQRNQLIKEIVQGAGIRGEWKDVVLNKEIAQRLRVILSQKVRNSEFQEDLEGVRKILDEIAESEERALSCGISIKKILRVLDDESCSSLFIVNSHDPHSLRLFSYQLGEQAYESRRQTGRIFPLVSFIFDEADEFIRVQGKSEHESYERSREISHTIARRGRKFGLGLGIATQRIRYLDTSIMAQPHTYLVSKLPRKSDREGVAEAFGIPEEMFRQTFTFKAGNWLLLSHDAAGLKAVPVPIATENANERIANFLESL